jgi:glycosyltransferase involved in cell wall biosynthesis
MVKITIGMTAYNSEEFIEDSIKSLLAQTTPDIKIVISDDASNDGTQEICRRWMTQDSRIHYIRQEKNLGPRANFEFVFKQCDTEYFMWASHDDVWSPSFIEQCISELETNQDAGFVITRWIVESRTIPFLRRFFLPNMGFVTDPDPIKRLIAFTSLSFSSFKDNLAYGIWRRQALTRVIADTNQIKYFSIGGAANEYALLLYRGCYITSAYFRKRYKYAPPGSFMEPFLSFLSDLMWWRNKGNKCYATYTPQDHIKDLVTVFNKAGLDSQKIEHAVRLNKVHLNL